MKKIVTLRKLSAISHLARRDNKKVGLITGCFDILHEGHIDLFRFAKRHVDILIVALDSDQAIKSGKGDGRPIHNQIQRAKVLSELESVDFVMPITDDYAFTKASVEPVHDKIRRVLKPHYLITSIHTDSYWQSKKNRAEKEGVKMLLFKKKTSTSTTGIVEKINSEI